jgi:hypothetical protein
MTRKGKAKRGKEMGKSALGVCVKGEFCPRRRIESGMTKGNLAILRCISQAQACHPGSAKAQHLVIPARILRKSNHEGHEEHEEESAAGQERKRLPRIILLFSSDLRVLRALRGFILLVAATVPLRVLPGFLPPSTALRADGVEWAGSRVGLCQDSLDAL